MTDGWVGRSGCPTAAARAIDAIFGKTGWTVQPLAGGMTNQNWRVRFDDGRQDAVLQVQLPSQDAGRLGIRREVQAAMELITADLDLGPRVLGRSQEPLAIASEYVEAVPLPSHGPARARGIREVASALRRLHAVEPPAGVDLQGRLADGFGCITWLLEDVGTLAPAVIEANREAIALIEEFEELRGPYQPCLVHSDLSAGNVLVGERTYLIDWEYSGLGDCYYDLGGFSARNDLDDAEECSLVEAYLGIPDERVLAIVRLYRFLTIFAEALWGAAAADIGFGQFDHAGYSQKFFADTRDAAGAPWLRTSIDYLRTNAYRKA